MDSTTPSPIMRRPDVCRLVGRARSTIYADEAAGLLPKPFRLGKRSVAYPAQEIVAVVQARMAGRTDDEIRALVAEMHAARSGEL